MAAKVTPYQERVYALLVQIPSGRITSYKSLSDALNSSPRAIGGALRNNPFAPEVVSFSLPIPPFTCSIDAPGFDASKLGWSEDVS
ncbi:hypothetical protein V494_02240 [Pseudogymnoascus sp. VKM F-4513 (FW-928)]|nr:hypothetical protein V494_02240 [Pseudogymnoascus sp. VKM F-4513 (FW-928)]